MEFEPIPGPPGLPIVGNLTDIDGENPLLDFDRLTDIYGLATQLHSFHCLLLIGS